MDIIKNIIDIRNKHGINQEFIANALGVDTAVVSRIENRKRALKVDELEIIANALGEDILYLMTYPHSYIKKEDTKTQSFTGDFEILKSEKNLENVKHLKISEETKESFLIPQEVFEQIIRLTQVIQTQQQTISSQQQTIDKLYKKVPLNTAEGA